MKAAGQVAKIERIVDSEDHRKGSTVVHIGVPELVDLERGAPVFLSTEDADFRDAEVVKRVRDAYIARTKGQYRGWHSRCSYCSWTWDDGAPEKHEKDCILAPFGEAPTEAEASE